MLQRAPETSQKAIKLPGFIWHVKLHEKYCWRGDKSFQVILYGYVTNIDIPRLCEIHIDLICPDKRRSIIILVIILKCYISQQWPGFSVNCKRIRFYTCFLWFYSCAFWRILLVLQDLWKRLSKIKQINKLCYKQ